VGEEPKLGKTLTRWPGRVNYEIDSGGMTVADIDDAEARNRY